MRLGRAMKYIAFSENKSDRQIASEIGISPSTFGRIQQGHGVNADTFVKVLTWLTAEDRPEQVDLPSSQEVL